MNRTILTWAALLLTVAAATAQHRSHERHQGERSLAERVFGLEKKSEKLKVNLGVQSFFEHPLNDDESQRARFKVHELRIQAHGELSRQLSFDWRQRLNRAADGSSFADNLSNAIDIAGVDWHPNEKVSFFFGRQYARFGGIEYDMNPVDIYQYSDLVDYMTCYTTGVNFAWNLHPQHQVQLQILNAYNDSFEDRYQVTADVATRTRYPLLYTTHWNGTFLQGALHMRYAVSLGHLAKERNLWYFTAGHLIRPTRNIDGYIDLTYSIEGLDDKGIMSMRYGGGKTLTDVKYAALVSKWNFRIDKSINLFAKGMYEHGYAPAQYGNTSHTRHSYGYMGGVEYYPTETNFRLFLTYIGRHYRYNATDTESTNTLRAGFIYQIPFL